MADVTVQTATIAASPERCWEIVTDFEQYPAWAHDLQEARITSRDEQGRAIEVEFTAAAIGRTTSYTLHYDYSGAPERLSWKLVQGDIMESCEGTYTFTPSTSLLGATDVVYDLAIELLVPMPGFVKRRAEVRILHNGIRELKAVAEQAP